MQDIGAEQQPLSGGTTADSGEFQPDNTYENAPVIPRYGSLWVDMLAITGVMLAAQFVGAAVKIIVDKMVPAEPELGIFLSYVIAFGITIIFALWLRASRLRTERVFLEHSTVQAANHAWKQLKKQSGPLLRFSLKKTSAPLILWGFIMVIATSTVLEPLLLLFPDKYLEFLDAAIGAGGWAVLTTVVCAPILEEILFRGIMQEAITRRYGALRGIVCAAAIFGIIHVLPQQAVNAFFIGLILGYIYFRSGSLVPVIIIHAMNNALAYVMMRVFPEGTETVRGLIPDDTTYWIVYGVCALIFVIACVNVCLNVGLNVGKNAPKIP